MSTVTVANAWSLLFVAGLLEVVWAISMKASEGFTRHASAASRSSLPGFSGSSCSARQ
jgi:multidrug transporter EmrE-like cation transporter